MEGKINFDGKSTQNPLLFCQVCKIYFSICISVTFILVFLSFCLSVFLSFCLFVFRSFVFCFSSYCLSAFLHFCLSFFPFFWFLIDKFRKSRISVYNNEKNCFDKESREREREIEAKNSIKFCGHPRNEQIWTFYIFCFCLSLFYVCFCFIPSFFLKCIRFIFTYLHQSLYLWSICISVHPSCFFYSFFLKCICFIFTFIHLSFLSLQMKWYCNAMQRTSSNGEWNNRQFRFKSRDERSF